MSRYIYRLLTIICISVFCGRISGQTWIQIDKQKSEKAITTEILKSDQYGYQVKVFIHGLSSIKFENEKGEFYRVTLGDEIYLSKIGEPSLPLFTQSIAIPAGAKASASITEEKWTDLEIGRILPKQKPLLETEKAKGFDINEKLYHSSYIPPLLSMSSEMQWRSIRNTNIAICPFRYYPKENRLSVMNEFILQISFSYDQGQSAESNFEPDDPLRLFDNLPYINSYATQHKNPITKLSRNANEYDYLIIVSNNNILNSNKMKEFQRWKAFKGYRTNVVSTATTGTTATQIKNYIANEISNGIKYVLFVGDNDQIPMYGMVSPYDSQKWINSDYWYGCLTGNDAIEEIPIGRFATNSLDEFSNMVNKTIKYESSYVSSNKVLLVAHHQYQNYYQHCCETIRDSSYNESMTFEEAFGESYATSSTNSYVVGKINEGVHIVNYRGHGKTGFWGGPEPNTNWNLTGESFTTDEIDNMNNETSAVFFSVACNTGNIAHPDTLSMLEVFTRSPHGAVAYLGASIPTYTDINHHYDRLLFKSLLNEKVYHFGDINLRAHKKCILKIDSLNTPSSIIPVTEAEHNAYSYICGGDPALELWTATPQKINANVSITNGNITVNTGLSGNYNISIVSEDGQIIDYFPCTSSTSSFTLPASNFYVAVNKHNYFPYIFYYDSDSEEVVPQDIYFDAYFINSPLTIGDPMDEEKCVKVKKGYQVKVKIGNDNVTIVPSFECEKGAVFEVK